MQLTHRGQRPLPARVQDHQIYQLPDLPPDIGAAQDQLAALPPDFGTPGLAVIPPALYALQNSTDFDVIYEKNSIEEMENSVLSRSRMSKVSRISGLGAESQPGGLDTHRSEPVDEPEFSANCEIKGSAGRREGVGKATHHEPKLSGTLNFGELRRVVISVDQYDRP